MHNTPALLQIEPLGKPAADVGIFIIERLFTKVAHALFAVMLLPAITVLMNVDVLLQQPPTIAEKQEAATLQNPPLITEDAPEEVL